VKNTIFDIGYVGPLRYVTVARRRFSRLGRGSLTIIATVQHDHHRLPVADRSSEISHGQYKGPLIQEGTGP